MTTIPTTAELETICLTSLQTQFGIPIDPDGKAELRAQAATEAALLKSMYLAIADVEKNIFVDTCDEPTLIRFGLIKLDRQPFSAIAAQYDILVTGTVGAIIPAGSIFKSDDTALNPAVLYRLDDVYTMVTGSDIITVRCLIGGDGGALDIGNTLTSTSPIPLVNSGVTVTAEAVQPLEAETIEDYRAKVWLAFRLEAQGGASTDYRLWAIDAQGVSNVYPYAESGVPCGVIVFVEATPADSIDGKGTPSQQTLDDVEDVFEFDPDTTLPQNERGRRPTQVVLNLQPITPKDVVITITGYQGLTAQIQTDLSNAFNAEIKRTRPFVAAADALADKNDIIDTNKLNGIIYTTKPGSVYVSVTFTVGGILTPSYTFLQGNIPFFDINVIYN